MKKLEGGQPNGLAFFQTLQYSTGSSKSEIRVIIHPSSMDILYDISKSKHTHDIDLVFFVFLVGAGVKEKRYHAIQGQFIRNSHK